MGIINKKNNALAAGIRAEEHCCNEHAETMVDLKGRHSS